MPSTPSSPLRLSAVETFKDLSAADLELLESRLEPLSIQRGVTLVKQGDAPDCLYVVVSGRFAVEVHGVAEPVAEIAAGSPIGEIAFFAGGARTATVRAIRDSVVVALTRADFDEISARAPAIWQKITAALSNRLAAATRQNNRLQSGARPRPRPRTIALVRAGEGTMPADFLAAFTKIAAARPRSLVLDASRAKEVVGSGGIETIDATRLLNDLEATYDTIVFLADADLTPWSEKAIRQADEVVFVGGGDGPFGGPVPLNALEKFALVPEQRPQHRLVLVHSHRGGVQGTRHWLENRAVGMHHHVASGVLADVERVWRFVSGEALGFVACGGGAYCAAHVGLYKAFGESGIDFDLFVGTSGGAAMAAAFASEIPPQEIDERIHRMFITGKALQHYTIPRYSVFDHTHFDRHLMSEYGNTLIEDLWKPYFAVSMDLADCSLEVHRTGPVWSAIRASAAIPALLPPFYTERGQMLVDGSVIANVPIDVMHQIKTGPNIVVTFSPAIDERSRVDYRDLPARRDLVWRSMNPWSRRDLPKAPSAATVLIRSLMANRNHFERHLEPGDWLLMPPTPEGMGALDWRRHSELVDAAYHYGLAEIKRKLGTAPAKRE